MSRTEEFQRAYAGGHQPPQHGAPLHDLLATEHFPRNVYDELHHYTHMSGQEPADRESVRAVQSHRGRPDANVTVYRAAPAHVTHINPGDWVTLSKSYAKQHAMQTDNPKEDWPVHAAQVPAHTVRNGGNDIVEWGYHGPAPVPVTRVR
jgi:hypothetical protein